MHPTTLPFVVTSRGRGPTSWRASLALLLALLLAVPQAARASIFGEENGPLAALVAQGVANLAKAADTLRTIQQTYDETRRYVGMAQDAVNGFNSFRAYADSVLREPAAALGNTLPGGAYLARELKSPHGWGAGTGELQRLVTVCLTGSQAGCTLYPEAVQALAARDAIAATHGLGPGRLGGADDRTGDAQQVADIEAARAIKGATEANGRASLAAAQAQALMEKCTAGTDSAAMQACQSAANVGQLLQVQQTALLNEQLAEANRLKAVELAGRNGEAKRAEWQKQQRDAMLREATELMAPPRVRFETGAAPSLEAPR